MLGMRWQDIDLEAGVWKQVAERTKNRSKLDLPLSPTALSILKGIRERRNEEGAWRRESDWVFPARTKSGHVQSVDMPFRRALEIAGHADRGFHPNKTRFCAPRSPRRSSMRARRPRPSPRSRGTSRRPCCWPATAASAKKPRGNCARSARRSRRCTGG